MKPYDWEWESLSPFETRAYLTPRSMPLPRTFYHAEFGRPVKPYLLPLCQSVRAYLHRTAWKIGHLASCLSRSLKVIGTDTDPLGTSYQCSIAIRGFYRFQDISRYWPKIANFPHRTHFDASQRFPLELGNCACVQKTRLMVLPRQE